MMNQEMMAMMAQMNAMMETMQKMMSTMVSNQPQVAPAEVVEQPVTPTTPSFKVSADTVLAESKTNEPSEFGFWKALNREGNEYTWCGWANPNNGESNFPGHRMYRINDFYLKSLGIHHSGYRGNDGNMRYSSKYNMRGAEARGILARYQVRTEVAKKDEKAFMEYMEKASPTAKQAFSKDWIAKK
jgi:hypothetical protein